MLTASHRTGDLKFLVVGERANGDRVVLGSQPSAVLAQQLCDRLAAHLEGYRRFVVDRVGHASKLDARPTARPFPRTLHELAASHRRLWDVIQAELAEDAE